MKEVIYYRCEICNTVYPIPEAAEHCEARGFTTAPPAMFTVGANYKSDIHDCEGTLQKTVRRGHNWYGMFVYYGEPAWFDITYPIEWESCP